MKEIDEEIDEEIFFQFDYHQIENHFGFSDYNSFLKAASKSIATNKPAQATCFCRNFRDTDTSADLMEVFKRKLISLLEGGFKIRFKVVAIIGDERLGSDIPGKTCGIHKIYVSVLPNREGEI